MESKGLGELSILPDQWWCLVVSEIWNRRKHTSWNTPRKRQSSCVVKIIISEKILRLIHLFGRLLFFYFPIIWLDWFICSKGFYYFIFQLFGQIEKYKQNNFSINRWVCHSFDFSLQETDFQPLRELEVIIEQGTWNGYGKKAQRKFYFFSVFVAVVFVSRKQNQVNFIFAVRLKKLCRQNLSGLNFFPLRTY